MSKKKRTTKKSVVKTPNQDALVKQLQVENKALLEAANAASEAAAKAADTPAVPVIPAQPALSKPEAMKDKPSVTDVKVAMTKKEFQKVIDAYKIQNPVKYERKKVALEAKLKLLKG